MAPTVNSGLQLYNAILKIAKSENIVDLFQLDKSVGCEKLRSVEEFSVL